MNFLVVLFAFVYPLLHPTCKLRRIQRRRRILLQLAEHEMQHLNPRRYSQINVSVPLLARYFDGHSDLRVDFRLARESFNSLMAVLGTECDHGWGPEINTLVFLFWLASATSYRVVARAFDMPWSTVHQAVHRVSAKIAALLSQVVRHPTAEELPRLGSRFARLAGSAAFNRVVGAIDGCHIRVKPLQRTPPVILTGSCSTQSSCRPSVTTLDGFWTSSWDTVGQFMTPESLRTAPSTTSSLTPPPGYCILGDGGYPCLSQPICLMTPYRQPVRNHLQARFNCHLSKARCVVERSFGVLKTRWRSIFLKALEVDVKYVPEVIVCCTVLHNICMSNGDLLEPDTDADVGRAVDQPAPGPAPPGTVSGADERQRMAMTCYTPDHDYI